MARVSDEGLRLRVVAALAETDRRTMHLCCTDAPEGGGAGLKRARGASVALQQRSSGHGHRPRSPWATPRGAPGAPGLVPLVIIVNHDDNRVLCSVRGRAPAKHALEPKLDGGEREGGGARDRVPGPHPRTSVKSAESQCRQVY